MGNVIGLVILLAIGAILGLLLAIADKAFTVKEDERLEPLKDLLPGINCGTCGYPGCKEMAQGMLKGEVRSVSQCKPSRPDARKAIKEFLDSNPDENGNFVNIQL